MWKFQEWFLKSFPNIWRGFIWNLEKWPKPIFLWLTAINNLGTFSQKSVCVTFLDLSQFLHSRPMLNGSGSPQIQLPEKKTWSIWHIHRYVPGVRKTANITKFWPTSTPSNHSTETFYSTEKCMVSSGAGSPPMIFDFPWWLPVPPKGG